MKVSSLTASSIESSMDSSRDAKPFMQMIAHIFSPVAATLNRIGTAIALGETGNLEAAHEFRQNNSGQ
jgi:hypothetical protein